MKKHSSIFAFLLCAFVAVGWTGAANASAEAYVLSDSPGKVTASGASCILERYKTNPDRYYATVSVLGDDVTLSAPTRTGYRFLGWYGMVAEDTTGDKTTYENCTSLIESGSTISEAKINASKKGALLITPMPVICMKYEPVVTIETAVSPTKTGSAALTTTDTAYKTDGRIAIGKSCTLTATPATGYAFKWWEHGTDTKTDNPLTFTVAASDAGTFTAVFTQKVYTVTFHDENKDKDGYADVVQNVTHGTAATAPNWTRYGYSLAWSPEDFTKVTSDMTITARWTKFPRSRVTLTVGGPSGEKISGDIVSGSGEFDYGVSSTLQAHANDGSKFIEWRLPPSAHSARKLLPSALFRELARRRLHITAKFDRIHRGLEEGFP